MQSQYYYDVATRHRSLKRYITVDYRIMNVSGTGVCAHE